MKTALRDLGVAVAALGASLAFAAPARAGGLYFADRGVRPLGRGGAFIAGGDDLGAIAYNPAGIYDAGAQFLVDASWLHFTTDYSRRALLRQVDPNTGQTVATYQENFPAVQGTTPFLPIPTIAGSFRPHPQWIVAIGAWAPYAAVSSYPDRVEGKPAPQRYSLISLDGTALAFVGAAAAFAPSKEWRFGVGLGAMVGSFSATSVFSGCPPDRFFCAPEDPSWDVLAEIDAGPIIAPTGELGAIWIPNPSWRVGASMQLPVYVRTSGTLRTRLPASPVFERASQEGDSVDVSFDLPWNIRLGVETRVIDKLRVELGLGYERWGMHDKIHLDPKGVALKNVAGFPETYNLPPVDIARNFQDTVSARLGGEYGLSIGGYAVDARAGISYETSAIPTESLSVLTFDAPKITLGLGASLHVSRWRFDVVYAHVFAFNVSVDPKEANIPMTYPLAGHPPPQPDTINGGDYSGRADVIGLGLAYSFDAQSPPQPQQQQQPQPAAPTPPQR